MSLKELKINFFSLRFNVDSSSWSKQLPSVIVFENGKETNRKPFISPKGTVVRYRFTKVCSFMIMIKFQYIWYLHGKYLPNFKLPVEKIFKSNVKIMHLDKNYIYLRRCINRSIFKRINTKLSNHIYDLYYLQFYINFWA